ncbi:MAG TPA: hypothetical protein VM536_09420, partial [Chloroflexia bacterium]|nr:hypothetical protein [Chloroflexia bacterium]
TATRQDTPQPARAQLPYDRHRRSGVALQDRGGARATPCTRIVISHHLLTHTVAGRERHGIAKL